MQSYHDEEWGVPVRDSRALWEMLILEGFQAGLSWQTILRRREGFRKAFKGFKQEIDARFDESDISRLMADEGIIRARAKIEATISNARVYLEMKKAGQDFSQFVWEMAGNKPIETNPKEPGDVPAKTLLSEEISVVLKKRGFKFVGPVITYSWMQAVGMVNDHIISCFRHREIGAAARSLKPC
jgi:DNA-3-methyladenine glycosylase I